MQRNIIFTITIILTTISCCGQEGSLTFDITKESLVGLNTRQPIVELFSETTATNYPVFVVGHTICVTRPRKGYHYAIDMYDSRTTREIGHCIDFESEGEEWLSPLYSLHDGCIIIRDNTVHKVAIVDIDAIMNDSNYLPKIRETNILSTRFIPFGDKVIFWNPYGHDPRHPRILVSDDNWHYEFQANYKLDAFNVDHGELLFNQENNAVVLAHSREPIIEIMDTSGKVHKKICFEHPSTEILSLDNKGITLYVYKKPFITCFSAACSNKDSFMVAYAEDEHTNKLLQFDWSGNLISGFQVSGTVCSLSFSSEGDHIWVWERIGRELVLRKYASTQE